MKLDRYLLGDNPFLGINHLSQESAREKEASINTSKIIEVIKAAVESGAEGFLFTTHPATYDALNQMKRKGERTNLGLYPILPYVQGYVRMATQKGISGLVKAIQSQLGWKLKAKALLAGSLSLASFDLARALRAYVDTELAVLRKYSPGDTTLRAVLLHEVITDLAVAFGASDIVEGFFNYVMDHCSAQPGFVTRNFPRFVDYVMNAGLKMDQILIVTPFNKAGFQMNPSKDACERTLDLPGVRNVIAMSVLASGFLELPAALQYLRELPAINAYVVGVSTPEHARETFTRMRIVLS